MYEANPLRNAITGDVIPADTRLFQRANLRAAIDSGAAARKTPGCSPAG